MAHKYWKEEDVLQHLPISRSSSVSVLPMAGGISQDCFSDYALKRWSASKQTIPAISIMITVIDEGKVEFEQS